MRHLTPASDLDDWTSTWLQAALAPLCPMRTTWTLVPRAAATATTEITTGTQGRGSACAPGSVRL